MLSVFAVLWVLMTMVFTVSCSMWVRCSWCSCRQEENTLLLNCSDSRLLEGDIRVPYAETYESLFNFSTISAEFRRSDLKRIGTLVISKLENLSLADNSIEDIPSFALMHLKNLKVFFIYNNSLAILKDKSLDGLEKLSILDLSRNKLKAIEANAFKSLGSLKMLSLSHNSITNVSGTTFSLPSLETLDLSYNNISISPNNSFANLPKLRNLYLSHNNIAIIDKFAFDSLSSLTVLDLSWNSISFLSDYVFSSLVKLTELYLDHNRLQCTSKDWDLPKTMRKLDLGYNFLKSFEALPSSLATIHELRLTGNSIRTLTLKNVALQQLRVLNAAFNYISELSIPVRMLFLEELNLSHNELKEIPATLSNALLPALRLLYLDYNPLLSVKFPAESTQLHGETATAFVNLTLVSLSHLPDLQELGPEAFTGLSAPCGLECGGVQHGEIELEEMCARRLAIVVSHCRRLSHIHAKAFAEVGVCKLDLSYNALATLDRDIANWNALKEVDLQGNPWDCTCSLQWLLDTVLPQIYKTHPQHLYELRCESPAKLRPWRLVHFLNWQHSALCGELEQLRARDSLDRGISVVTLGSSNEMIIVLVLLTTILVFLVTLGLLIQRRRSSRRRKYNRRF